MRWYNYLYIGPHRMPGQRRSEIKIGAAPFARRTRERKQPRSWHLCPTQSGRTVTITSPLAATLSLRPLVSRRAVAGKRGVSVEDCRATCTLLVTCAVARPVGLSSPTSAREFRRPPCLPSSTGIPCELAKHGGEPGRLFLWLLSFGRAKESSQLSGCPRRKSRIEDRGNRIAA
jgi:hypothetical protein